MSYTVQAAWNWGWITLTHPVDDIETAQEQMRMFEANGDRVRIWDREAMAPL